MDKLFSNFEWYRRWTRDNWVLIDTGKVTTWLRGNSAKIVRTHSYTFVRRDAE